MADTERFQSLADAARAHVDAVPTNDVAALMSAGAVALEIRQPDETAGGHIPVALNVSRGTLEMNTEAVLPDLDTTVLSYCNANKRGALFEATVKDMGYTQAHYIADRSNTWRKTTGPCEHGSPAR